MPAINAPADFDVDDFMLREWPEALESGEFQQGKSRLRIGDRYCCLGVACELLHRKGFIDRRVSDSGLDQGIGPVYVYENEKLALPKKVASLLNITQGGEFREKTSEWGERNGLIALNDTGTSFEDIAREIRSAYTEGRFYHYVRRQQERDV